MVLLFPFTLMELIGSSSRKAFEMTYLTGKIKMDETNIIVDKLLNVSSEELAIDGSVSAKPFIAAPPAGKIWIISRLLIYYSSSVNFTETGFAHLSGLATGISLMCNNTQILRWKNNLDVQLCMFDADGKGVFGKTTQSIAGRWTFGKHGEAEGLYITDTTNGIGLTVNDDLSGLSTFKARVEGIEYPA